MASRLSKENLAVIIDEIKTELTKIDKKAKYT